MLPARHRTRLLRQPSTRTARGALGAAPTMQEIASVEVSGEGKRGQPAPVPRPMCRVRRSSGWRQAAPTPMPAPAQRPVQVAALQVVAYLRVSTDGQTTDNQRPDLEQMATGRAWTVARWYVDEAVSGRAAVRPAFDEMMVDANRGRFRVLLIWSLDRFCRNMHPNIGDVLELDRLGVQVVSVKEPWLD